LRCLGIDPGSLSIDLCGIDGGRTVVDEAVPTRAALADPDAFVERLERLGPFQCIVGPSAYGLPLTTGADLSEEAIRLALLSPAGEEGGIGGLGRLLRALARSPLPIIFTPGVVHLSTVPAHRKLNRVDLGTADKVCAAALAIHDQAHRRRAGLADTSFILLELGGAFTAAVAVNNGRIVDGVGGSSGPIGAQASGGLDAEVAMLAGRVTKAMVFGGGVADVCGEAVSDADALAHPATARARLAWDAYIEGAVKAVAALQVTLPRPTEVILSGRLARSAAVFAALSARLSSVAPVTLLDGFARIAKQAAQGAALIADGLAGGEHASLVEVLQLRGASGSALDWLYVVTPEHARARLGIGRSAPERGERRQEQGDLPAPGPSG
jgi:predicted butyrate kinase (DUF1464 family)